MPLSSKTRTIVYKYFSEMQMTISELSRAEKYPYNIPYRHTFHVDPGKI